MTTTAPTAEGRLAQLGIKLPAPLSRLAPMRRPYRRAICFS